MEFRDLHQSKSSIRRATSHQEVGKPQLTETIAFMNPIEFPLKEEYERINNSVKGMKIRELRDGEPEVDEIEYDEDEYLPSEPGALDHEEIAKRAIDDEPDDRW